MRWRWSGGLAAALVSLGSPAWAVEFDAAGRAQIDGSALLSVDFESALPGGFEPLAEGAIEGAQAGRLAGRQAAALPAIPLGGQHALVATIFVRGPVTAYLLVRYKPDSQQTDALLPLFATGRVTSDGWYELRSSAYSVDAAAVELSYAYVQNLGDEPADVDAVEVVDAGGYRPATACKPPEDEAACGPDRVCQGGVCREAAAAVPALPPTADERAQVAALLSEQVDLFYGGLRTRELYLPEALAALQAMATETEAGAYWRQLLRAMHALHDAHTFGYVGHFPRGTTAACFVEGEADLSKALAPSDPTYPDILVSHALPEAGLAPGDRLVAVNGQHPIAFMRGLAGRYVGGFLGCDDTSHSYAAQSLATAIPTYATTVTVIACPGGVCQAPKTLPVAQLRRVDQGAIHCDHRAGFHLASGNPDAGTHQLPSFVIAGPVAGTTADEAIYGAAFNSFYPEAGSNPFTPVVDLARDKAKGLVIDHRAGEGGYSEFGAMLTEPLRLPALLGVSVSPQTYRYDPAFDQAKGKLVIDQLLEAEGFAVGSASPKPGLKAAVLIANGESAGDFFPFAMKGPSNIRVFGRRSQGAFSTAYYLAFGPMAWGFGSGDTFRPDGTSMIGTGITPDEEILPRQSDLTKGLDTVHERALEWLRTCTDCDGEVK